jgi:hypothetical protein
MVYTKPRFYAAQLSRLPPCAVTVSQNEVPLLTNDADIATRAYALHCPGCTNPACRTIVNPVAPYAKAREANPVCSGAGWPTPGDVAALQARGTEPCP